MHTADVAPVLPVIKVPLFAKCMARLRQTFNLRAWLLTILALIAGVGGSLALHDAILETHYLTVHEAVRGQADRAADELGDRFDVRRRAVARYASLWRLYERMTDDRWDILTKNLGMESKELQSVVWVDADYAVRKIATSKSDTPNGSGEQVGTRTHGFNFLKSLSEHSENVVVSPIVDWGADPRIFFVVPLHRKSGGFDGFLIFMYRADLILADTNKIIDPRMGFEISGGTQFIYRSPADSSHADMKQAVSFVVPFSDGTLDIKVYPLDELHPNQLLLAKALMWGGVVLTILIILMSLQMSYLARARREVIGSRLHIQAHEQRYRSLITGCDLGWVVLDKDLRVIEANEPYIRMTGYNTYAEIAGRPVFDWIDTSCHAAVARARGDVPVTQDYVDYRWPDGTVRHLHVDMTIREGRRGREVIALCRDVTEQTNALKDVALRDRAMEASSSAILITAMGAGGKAIYCNRAFENLTGYSRTDVIGSLPDFLGGDKGNAPELRRMQANLLAGQSAQANLITYRKDGERIVRHVSTTPVMGNDGRPTHMISISTDITDEERKAEHLRLRERAIEASQNGILIVDARQTHRPIIFANRSFSRITGYSADQVIGRNSSFLQGTDNAQPEIEVLRRALEEQRSISVVMRSYKKDSAMFWNELYVDPVIDETGKLTHFICIINDVTARKETEAQLLQVQKMDAIGQLTGGVAHDFNNLLTVVIGNSKLVQQTMADDEKQSRRLSLVVRAAERGADLTQRLLAFSRKQTLRTEILDVNGMVQDMQNLVQRTIGENITTEFALSDSTCFVCVDRGQLENALLNLAINARDAMPQGGRLIVTTKHVILNGDTTATMNLPPGRYIEMAVSDTGIGMTKAVKDRAFEPFFTTKDVGKGTGLGLSMVFGFVKQSEGHVSIYSEMGHGTTVKLYLPCNGANEGEAQTQVLPIPEVMGVPEGYKILVVEDDENVRATTSSILEDKGFTVVEASSADAALETIESSKDINLVFSDVIMPGKLNGIELFRLIRTRYPHIRVALTSGYPREALKLDIADSEGPLLINKPYDPKTLAKNLAYYSATGTHPRF